MLFRAIVVALHVGGLVWLYRKVKPPPPKVCGSPNGPSVTSPRIRLRDGRHLAYKERGASKETAAFKVILCHGYNDFKESIIPVSDEWLQEKGICLITFDRPGYCESDPNPLRSPKADALDIEELCDQLELGPKFYLVGLSLGMYPVWGSLKYIPHRLAGAALVVPGMNYWWPSLPAKLSNSAFNKLPWSNRFKFLAYHHAPKLAWLLHKWFPYAPLDAVLRDNPLSFCQSDREIMNKLSKCQPPDKDNKLQQGTYESQYLDFAVMFERWEFDPLEMNNPFSDSEGSVHLWIGEQDTFVSPQLQRHIATALPWIHCHQVSDGGHMIIYDEAHCKTIFKFLICSTTAL